MISKMTIYFDDQVAKNCYTYMCNYTAGPFDEGTSHTYYVEVSDEKDKVGRDPQSGEKTFFVSNKKNKNKGVLFILIKQNSTNQQLISGVKIDVQNEVGAVLSSKFTGDTPTIFTLDYGKYTIMITAKGYSGKMIQLEINKQTQQLSTTLSSNN